MLPLSILDLAAITQGSTASVAFRNSLDLARHAEALGYTRFWLAEHHNMPGIASSATAVLIAHIAAGTSTLRVGSGGVMLPNHAPLLVAEQFGTLEALYPGRIDLGLGRAPGTDPLTARALRRDADLAAERFPQDVQELQALLQPAQPGQAIRAVPGAGANVPIWLLGSSLYSAALAGTLGLPYAFAAHFAPDLLLSALATYRSRFRRSAQLQAPYAMVCVNVIAAADDASARYLFSSLQQAFVELRGGRPGLFPPPIDDFEQRHPPDLRSAAEHALSASIVGGPARVRQGLQALLDHTRADEIMVSGPIYDHGARLQSFERVAALAREMQD